MYSSFQLTARTMCTFNLLSPLHNNDQGRIKGIDRPFGRGVESRIIWSALVNWSSDDFLSYFKGPSSQCQQKTIRRLLITSQVTLTGQSHFMLIFVLRKVTLPNHINSVPWMKAVTPTPYHECTQLVQKTFWLNWMKVTWRSRQTACIHGMELELVLLRSFMVRSWCDRVHSWCGVDVTACIHGTELMRFGMLLVWFCKVILCIPYCTVYTAQ